MSAEQPSSVRNLHHEGVYQASKTAAQLKVDLEHLGALDKRSEKKIEKWRSRQSFGVAAIVFGVLALIVVVLFLPDAPAVIGIALLLLGGISGIVLVIEARKNIKAEQKHEFPDYRYLTSLGLVTLLEADTPSDALLDMRLNLQEKVEDPETTKGRKENTVSGKGKITWKKKDTRDPFFTLQGRLQDGTKFHFSLVEEINCYGEYFPYRALSGKTKIKLRARKRVRWVGMLRLKIKKKRYTLDASELANVESCIQLPEGASVKKVSVTDDTVMMSGATAPEKHKVKQKMTKNIEKAWESMPVNQDVAGMLSHFSAMMFLSLYQSLNASKTDQQQP